MHIKLKIGNVIRLYTMSKWQRQVDLKTLPTLAFTMHLSLRKDDGASSYGSLPHIKLNFCKLDLTRSKICAPKYVQRVGCGKHVRSSPWRSAL